MKKWAFDPQNTFGSQTYNFCFGVKCLFFCLICLFSLSEGIYYQWKNKSDLKKIVLTLEKMSIWHQKHCLRFFPNTKRLPMEKWKKKNAVNHEICCRIIFWVLRINNKFFSYLKHCTVPWHSFQKGMTVRNIKIWKRQVKKESMSWWEWSDNH